MKEIFLNAKEGIIGSITGIIGSIITLNHMVSFFTLIVVILTIIKMLDTWFEKEFKVSLFKFFTRKKRTDEKIKSN